LASNKRISIIGLGHVGLPLAAKIASLGLTVLGYDSNPGVISLIREGKTPFFESGLSELLGSETVRSNLKLVESFEGLSDSGIIIVTVGTPVNSKGEPVLSSIDECTDSVGKILRSHQLVIYRSTIPPGTLRRRIKPRLERASGLSSTADFSLAYCPERLVEGAALSEIVNVPHIVGGIDQRSSQSAAEFFESIGCECLVVSHPEVAEMAKIIDNVYRDTNIALANEFSLYCEEFGIDVIESIKAANSSPRTKMLIPGCGVGGSCLNKDPYIPISMMSQKNDLSVIASGRKTNESMPIKFAEFLASKLQATSSEITIALLGIAFKAGTDDTRETVTIPIARKLLEKGFKLRAFDPRVSMETSRSLLPEVDIVKSVKDAVRDSSAIVLCSDHEEFRNLDLDEIRQVAKHGCILIDGRNILEKERVVRSGLRFAGLGRASSLE
jgi:nucleotide sugar dehydrogenase